MESIQSVIREKIIYDTLKSCVHDVRNCYEISDEKREGTNWPTAFEQFDQLTYDWSTLFPSEISDRFLVSWTQSFILFLWHMRR